MTLFLENIGLALASLKANKSRTFLTMLGIIIGIAAVIAIETVGNSLTLSVSDSMQEMGANNITVYLNSREQKADESEDGIVYGTVSKKRATEDSDLFTDQMIHDLLIQFSDTVDAVSVEESVDNYKLKVGNNSKNISVTGVSMGYFVANSINMLAGRTLNSDEILNARNVIVVGSNLVDDLYDGDYEGMLDKTLKFTLKDQDIEFTVIGVYEYMETMMNYGSSAAYIPLATAQGITHNKNYNYFSVVAKVGVDSSELTGQLRSYLNGFYRNNKYFEVGAYSMSSMVSIFGDMLGKITTAISVIAGIALLVGGIGVMNIMLVSITERTREIGTRKALGATNGYIRMQFIIEAVVICVIGGSIGILLGVAMGMVGADILGFAAAPSASSIISSLVFSMTIGIFFGYYPANKAAKMNPIDALRYE